MERKTSHNTGFASGGVTCKVGALCFYSSVVLVDSFVLRNPPERKARKRCGACKKKKTLIYSKTLNQEAMRKLILTLLLSISIVTGFGQETGKNFIDQNYIEVTGHADKEVTPNKIYLKFFINEKDFKNQSLAEVESKMIQKLKEIGINVDQNLSIKDFVSNFQNYWVLKSDIRLIKEYQLLVNDARTAGIVFIEFEKLGISSISIEKLENTEIDKYELEVKVDAIKSAQEKATAIANSINQNIGRAIFIQESPSFLRVENALQGRVAGIQIRGISSLKESSGSSSTNIEFEKIKIEYNIIVRFELK